MSSSVNELLMKIIGLNLIVVGAFAVAVPVIAIYLKKYDDKQQITRLYIYLAGGIILILIGALIYR